MSSMPKVAPQGAAHMRRRSTAQAFRAEDIGAKGPEKRRALNFPKGGRKDPSKPCDFGKRNKLLCEARVRKAAGIDYAEIVAQAAAIAPLTRREAV